MRVDLVRPRLRLLWTGRDARSGRLQARWPSDGARTFATDWHAFWKITDRSKNLRLVLASKTTPTNPNRAVAGLRQFGSLMAKGDWESVTFMVASDEVYWGLLHFESPSKSVHQHAEACSTGVLLSHRSGKVFTLRLESRLRRAPTRRYGRGFVKVHSNLFFFFAGPSVRQRAVATSLAQHLRELPEKVRIGGVFIRAKKRDVAKKCVGRTPLHRTNAVPLWKSRISIVRLQADISDFGYCGILREWGWFEKWGRRGIPMLAVFYSIRLKKPAGVYSSVLCQRRKHLIGRSTAIKFSLSGLVLIIKHPWTKTRS